MRRIVVAAGLAVGVLLTGCTASGSGSRATFYESLDDLAADSAAVVVGSVVSVTPEDGSTVISRVEVENVPAAPRLAADVPGGAVAVSEGDTLGIRQFASGEAAVARLQEGGQYLLYLVPTGLDDGLWYVSGATAGIWRRDGDTFVRVDPRSGDDLPATIHVAD